jgi:hypothetical protein
MNGQKILHLVMVVLGSTFCPSLAQDVPRSRLLVLTDISSLTAGVAEPDDAQSLIRLMLYANEFEIEGLIATSNLLHRPRTRPDLIRQVVDAYEKVRPNLLLHDPRYPAAEVLRRDMKAGTNVPVPRCRSWNRSARGRTPKPPPGSSSALTAQIRALSGL